MWKSGSLASWSSLRYLQVTWCIVILPSKADPKMSKQDFIFQNVLVTQNFSNYQINIYIYNWRKGREEKKPKPLIMVQPWQSPWKQQEHHCGTAAIVFGHEVQPSDRDTVCQCHFSEELLNDLKSLLPCKPLTSSRTWVRNEQVLAHILKIFRMT